ncbi:MAG: type I DNA topoisomerase [Candidatus Desulfofervidaceae bacterium]|nr:type I DNA topoisomerase [Candidatus Desulfofervidaceae bacterium]
MKLLIVESPAKARTLKKLLKDFAVEATLGHVKDLPKNKLGVDIERQFKPSYVLLPGKQKILQKIRKLAASAQEIYLGSDPDREGEAIAWHVAEEINKKNKKVQIKRVLFHEITPQAVKEAIAHPTSLDPNKYASQQTRRILDRLVGYKISPLLWEKVKRGLSAGRVQSVALRLVCERERAIQNFVPEEYWEIVARLEGKAPPVFEAKLVQIKGKKCHLSNQAQAEEVVEILKKQTFVVKKITRKEKRRYPAPPFITSTLQQEAAKKLGFSAQKTMAIAQQLYEGIDLGPEGRVGLITYMRTDSVRTADVAIKEARQFIKETWPSLLPARPCRYKNKRQAQDAHEAIRPTSVYRRPELVASYLTPDQKALYELIWKRFIASQMTPAIYDLTTVDIEATEYLFRATGSILKDPGFKQIYEETQEDTEKEKAISLPLLQEKEILTLKEIIPSQHFTKPPARYTEASLIKELEEKGIGRPSTYATILSTIQERKYVEKEKGRFKPTELGFLVNDLLVTNFPDIVDVSFTARMEADLDEIEEGKKPSLETLKAFYPVFTQALEQAQKHMVDVKKRGVKTEVICDQCGAPMVIKYGKNGAFLACSRYPECKNTKEFIRNDKGEITIVTQEVPEELCPQCGSPLKVKHGRYGAFLACSAYPKCRFTKPLEERDIVIEDKECPTCGAPLVIKRNKKGGRFLACSRYPECKYAAPLTLGIKCPQCGEGELVEQLSKKGRVFYGCSRYPQCKFVMWERPVLSPCPQCGAEFRVIKGSNLVCIKCGYKEKAA